MTDHQHQHEPGTDVGSHRPRKTRAQRTREAQRALELHEAGMEDVYICEQLGISRRTLYRRIQYALALVVEPTVAEYRELAIGRTRALRRTVYEVLGRLAADTRTLLNPETGETVTVLRDPATVARLVESLDRLESQEAKLRGAYAPTQVHLTVQQADAWDSLNALLAQNDPAPGTPEHP